ncbi:alpha-amylase family glycosyl hydrolase [Aestuariimicrobium kwangyangense]|uniref:alpha-amylase family glycosyl hydrolase n=1 Tax=Aestuariimicrobium kwangyangense TaxID=396389 RepID=UPI001FE21F0D|nr:alpha-amylase family glycosyl hydrolase [Aestuariimicrobium kwangyangense]
MNNVWSRIRDSISGRKTEVTLPTSTPFPSDNDDARWDDAEVTPAGAPRRANQTTVVPADTDDEPDEAPSVPARRSEPEVQTGMGAIVHDGGVAFRVWAPNAQSVTVVGQFNDWDKDAHPLDHEQDGYWYTDVPGAKAGQEYQFVLRNGDQELWRIDPYAYEVTNSVGNGVIVDHSSFDWQGDTFETPHLNNLVIYEMHVGSFAQGPDGTGDLQAVTKQLDHLDRLGINCIELMPLMEFAGDQSWGYNPAHIFAVESSYGGPNALKVFVREAHKRGISVLVDVVYNHFGPSDLDLWQFDGWSENDKGGIYFFNDWRSETPWGDTRPDYGRPEVRQFLRDNALMWLRDYHLQGLRFDMTPYMRSVSGFDRAIPEGWDVCRFINDEVRRLHPGAITIAEDLHGEADVTSIEDGGAGFHSQWDQHFVHPVRAQLTTLDDNSRSIAAVANAVTFSYGDAYERTIYTESHDEVANGKARVNQEVDPDDPQGWFATKRSTLGAALTLTSPGVPMLFQGQEFLQGGWFSDDIPLDWDLLDDFVGIARLYRDLVRLRLNAHGTSLGLMGQHTAVMHANDENKVFAYHRSMNGGPGDDVVVVVNLRNHAWDEYRIGFPAAGEWKLLLNSDAKIYSDTFGDQPATDVTADDSVDQDGQPASAAISIGAYSVLVFGRA